MDIVTQQLISHLKNSLAHAADKLHVQDCEIEVMGEGEKNIEFRVRANAGMYPGTWRSYTAKLVEHKVYHPEAER